MPRQPVTLRAKALAMLARREYSRSELGRKLTQAWRNEERRKAAFAEAGEESFEQTEAVDASKGEASPDAEIRTILDDFERRGWLSEARFVEASVNRMSRRYGPRRIEQTLREKGASDASIETIRPYLKNQAEATAREALKRRFSEPPRDAEQRARQVRFLQGRGFDYDVIRKVLNHTLDPAEE